MNSNEKNPREENFGIPNLQAEEVLNEVETRVAQRVAASLSAENYNRENRIKLLLKQAEKNLQNLEPVEITEEMVELGIEERVRELILQYTFAEKFIKLLKDSDDDLWDESLSESDIVDNALE